MALWPFRRKSDRKRSRSGAALSDAEGPPPRRHTDGVAREASKKKQRIEPAKLQRRNYSFSPGRNDSIRIDRRRKSRERPRHVGTGAAAETSWERTPTLNHGDKRRPSRKKTQKRRLEEREREREIKALSNRRIVHPATENIAADRITRESRRATAGGFRRHWDDPVSDVSLPLPPSITSSLSSDSEFGSFKVSAFAALAPRPTIRYAPSSKWTHSHISAPARSGSQKRPLGDRPQLDEETLRAHKRIDDLVDDLDAGDLRELMEREDRRRARKQQRDSERLKRRLADAAETKRLQEAEAKKEGIPQAPNLERGVMGRELVGLGIEPPSTVVTPTQQRSSVASEPMPDAEQPPNEGIGTIQAVDRSVMHGISQDSSSNLNMAPEVESEPETGPIRQPEPEPVPMSTETLPIPEDEEISHPPTNGKRFSGLLRSKKSRSKSTLGSEKDTSISAAPDRGSEVSKKGKTNRFSFSALLRQNGKNRRSSEGQPSFSNTSREEMQAPGSTSATNITPTAAAAAAAAVALAQAQALAKLQGEEPPTSNEGSTGNYIMRRSSASAPKRTKSRFREDLPDFPTPPQSRVQSPETEMNLPVLPEQEQKLEGDGTVANEPAAGNDTPTSDQQAIEGKLQTPVSVGRMSEVPSPDPHLSMSLASIDSEGSWLSGRMSAQRASARHDSIARNTQAGTLHSTDSPTSSAQEDLAIADDEYLSRLAPNRNSALLGRKSGEGRPSSDEEEFVNEEEIRYGLVGHKAQLVQTHRHDRRTMQSQEGLINRASMRGEDSDPPTPSEELAPVQRATSVHLGKGHARNFSAGSAKLLDITPRNSVDGKQARKARRSSEPL